MIPITGHRRVEGKRVLVIGAGRSGMAAASLLVAHGAQVRLTDHQPRPAWAKEALALHSLGVEIEAGKHHPESVAWVGPHGFVAVSPGVPIEHPLLDTARTLNIEIVPEVDIASWFLTCPIIGVTGTKGKTTTVSLIGALLKAGGYDAIVAGNIGTALCRVVMSLEQTPQAPDRPVHQAGSRVVVAELSSFQLELVHALEPSMGVILNITEDHLDRHRSMDVYAAAKANLVRRLPPDGVAVLNAESSYAEWLQGCTSAKVWRFSSIRPVRQGVWLGDAGKTIVSDLWNGQSITVCRAEDLLIKGLHNVENAMAAVAVAAKWGVSVEAVRAVLTSFAGVAHRQEHVGTVGGITFVNNSQGTNIDAVSKSLMSYDGPIVLIAGGRSKGAKFEQLRSLVSAKVKAVLLIGEATEEIASALNGCASIVMRCDSLESAVVRGYQAAAPGDVVLLSPACTSFDMFTNYEHRGEVFREAVRALEPPAAPLRAGRFVQRAG